MKLLRVNAWWQLNRVFMCCTLAITILTWMSLLHSNSCWHDTYVAWKGYHGFMVSCANQNGQHPFYWWNADGSFESHEIAPILRWHPVWLEYRIRPFTQSHRPSTHLLPYWDWVQTHFTPSESMYQNFRLHISLIRLAYYQIRWSETKGETPFSSPLLSYYCSLICRILWSACGFSFRLYQIVASIWASHDQCESFSAGVDRNPSVQWTTSEHSVGNQRFGQGHAHWRYSSG